MHQYWNSVPVTNDHSKHIGEVDATYMPDAFVPLPEQFEWSESNTNKEIYEFLCDHYVRDEKFAFDYTEKFIEWSTTPEWNLGIRCKSNGKLVGFIGGMPSKYRIRDKILPMLQASYLCVHKNLRNQRIAPLLIAKFSIWAPARGFRQAVYTGDNELPGCVAKCGCWHKPLFNVNNERVSEYKIMQETDIPRVTDMLSKYMERYDIAPVIDESWVRRWLMPKENIVYSYVSKNGFTSFYEVPYKSLKTGVRTRQANMFFNTSDNFEDAFILAKEAGLEMYTTVDTGLTHEMLKSNKFVKSGEDYSCYVYNWSCGSVGSENIYIRLF